MSSELEELRQYVLRILKKMKETENRVQKLEHSVNSIGKVIGEATEVPTENAQKAQAQGTQKSAEALSETEETRKIVNEERERDVHLRPLIKKIVHHPIFMLSIVVFAFILSFVSVFPIKIQQMGSGTFFVENIIPLPYWVGIIIIVGTTFLMIRYLNDRCFKAVFVFSSIVLMISVRMVFPIIFTTVPAYEPDAAYYISVVSSWARTGLDFGAAGTYPHDFPMSFLIAFAFVKFGVPVDTFFRLAPFFIYSIELIILYLLVEEIIPEDKRCGAISAFLFSFSSMGYWITVHYCPDLVGSLFYFVSLYLSVRFAKKGEWNVKALSPVLLSIFVLILSHHLSTLYFIITIFGLAFSTWFFKTPKIKGKPISFLMLGVYTYTLWFAYGTIVYPSFFNIYVYFSGFGSVSSLAQQAPLLDNAAFAVYPIFILMLSALAFFELLKVRSLRDVIKLRSKLREASGENAKMSLVYSLGFVFVGILFLAGFAIPATLPVRVLEVLFVGLYPVSSLTLTKVACANPSKKKMIVMLVLVILVTLVAIHRYYSQIQRRVVFA
jgi:hypothetical protein